MLIKDILNRLESGSSLKELSTEGIGKLMPLKRLSKAMRAAGYVSQNKGKAGMTWQFVGEGDPPLEISIFEFDSIVTQRKGTEKTTQQERINTVKITDIEEIYNVNGTDADEIENVSLPDLEGIDNANETHLEEIHNAITTELGLQKNVQTTHTSAFTSEEIATLKEVIAAWNQNKSASGVVEAAVTTTDLPLYERVRNIKQEKKMRKTLSINETVGKALDEFAKREKVYKADVIELALWDFMGKYSDKD